MERNPKFTREMVPLYCFVNTYFLIFFYFLFVKVINIQEHALKFEFSEVGTFTV